MTEVEKFGRLFIVAAPSGAGKTSLVQALLQAETDVRLSVSHTTRAPRTNEVDGREYHFVSAATFERMVREGRFLEHAAVFGNSYGTSRQAVLDQLAAGCTVILEIDWQGARQIRSVFPQAQGIFILPPSLDALRRRLRGRGTDEEEVIQRRLAEARSDIAHHLEFDFVVVNDDFNQALSDLRAVVRGHGSALRSNREQLRPLLASLMGELAT